MSDPKAPNYEPLVYTSVPVNGWVAVPATNLEKADGYVVLEKTGDFDGEHQKKHWHFNVVCIDGNQSTVVTSRLGEAIIELAHAISGWRPTQVIFNERINDKLSVLSTYTP